MNPGYKRLLFIAVFATAVMAFLEMGAYDIIKLQWLEEMVLQPAYKPMRDPLPVATSSIPIEGPAYILALGAPSNPVPADAASIARGQELFNINCVPCHGPQGLGNGIVGAALTHQPANLTGPVVQSLSDGAIFMVITNGMPGAMPALNENFSVRQRWDLVNFVRILPSLITPTATPAATATLGGQATATPQATPTP